MLLKLLAILFLLYFFFKSIGQVVRVIFGGNTATRAQNSYGNTNQQRKTSRDGLHVDSAPNQQKKKADFKGGDYVDYEEVD